jgi:hypothetical protein
VTGRFGTLHLELNQAEPRHSRIVLDLRIAGGKGLELSLQEARAVAEALSLASNAIEDLDHASRMLADDPRQPTLTVVVPSEGHIP